MKYLASRQFIWEIQGYMPLKFSIDPTRNPEKESFRFELGKGDIDLIPSRRFASKSGHDLKLLIEDDEQFWVDNRNAVLATFHTEAAKLLPRKWAPKRFLSCLVDASVFQPENIRTYLSLYDTVYLVLPLRESFERNCAALGVSSSELQGLIRTDRVKVLLPQSIDRYPESWLSSVAEAVPQNLLFSRRLAAATISEARRRVPLLYTPFSPVERYELLHAISSHAEEFVGAKDSRQFIHFITEFGEALSQVEWSVQSRGAMGTAHLGIGGIAAAIYEQITGRDLRLELWEAARKVEWAAVFGAHVFPDASESYDESVACNLVASIYGPNTRKGIAIAPRSTLSAITDLLAVDNEVPVLEFAKEFSSADIYRLRNLVLRLARENVESDSLSDAIARFNAEVHRYEKRPDLLKSLNVVGLFSAGAVACGVIDPSIQKIVPLAGILLQFILNQAIDILPRLSVTTGLVVDSLNSILARHANVEAVLVARTRKDVARLKS
jgi:hypothetical protein